ncbi:hypothetical protein BDR26DRAFT_1007764 [Obelidium mucronatum]|nr:hypothetical protein BDR26DRAFT_1007764 [Obelidium mucronatum]
MEHGHLYHNLLWLGDVMLQRRALSWTYCVDFQFNLKHQPIHVWKYEPTLGGGLSGSSLMERTQIIRNMFVPGSTDSILTISTIFPFKNFDILVFIALIHLSFLQSGATLDLVPLLGAGVGVVALGVFAGDADVEAGKFGDVGLVADDDIGVANCGVDNVDEFEFVGVSGAAVCWLAVGGDALIIAASAINSHQLIILHVLFDSVCHLFYHFHTFRTNSIDTAGFIKVSDFDIFVEWTWRIDVQLVFNKYNVATGDDIFRVIVID